MYDGEQGIALDPIQGRRASSRVDLGYTEQFTIPLETSVSFDTCEGVLRDSGVPSSKSTLLTCLIRNLYMLCTQCRGIGPRLSQRGKSHGFSQGEVGSWGIFSIYSRDGHSKLLFVQRCQDSCLVMMDISRI